MEATIDKIIELFHGQWGIATGPLFFLGFVALMWKGDEAISEAARKALSSSLLRRINPTPQPPDLILATFTRVFDRIFSKPEKSDENKISVWPRLSASLIASSFAVVLMFLVWLAVDNGVSLRNAMSNPLESAVFLLATAIPVNGLADYFSLMETRYVLARIQSGNKSNLRITLWLAADLAATSVIFLVVFPAGLTFGLIAAFSIEGKPDSSLWAIALSNELFHVETLASMLHLQTSSSGPGILGVFFYSSLFTSIWLWFFAISIWLTRSFSAVHSATRAVQWLLPFDERPVRAVGIVMGFIACLFVWFVVALGHLETWLPGVDAEPAGVRG